MYIYSYTFLYSLLVYTICTHNAYGIICDNSPLW